MKDIYKALFEIDDLDNSLVDLSMGILRDVLASKDYTDLSAMEKIAEELLDELQEKAEEWGVTFIQFKLTNCAPTEQTESLVNAEAGVKLKMQALAHAAKDVQKEIQDLPPSFAAALIGIPLVTSVTNEIHMPQPASREGLKPFLGIKLEDKRTEE